MNGEKSPRFSVLSVREFFERDASDAVGTPTGSELRGAGAGCDAFGQDASPLPNFAKCRTQYRRNLLHFQI